MEVAVVVGAVVVGAVVKAVSVARAVRWKP
jgi:hypothetical protein